MSEQLAEPTIQTWVGLSIKRGPFNGPLRDSVGLILHIVADPIVERFMEAQSRGIKISAAMYSNSWFSLEPNADLTVYQTPKNFIADSTYSLNYPGSPLTVGSNRYEELGTANIAFLRLVGISNPSGVRVGITGAYSAEYIRNTARLLLTEMNRFIKDYIAPVSIHLKLVSSS